MTAEPTATPPPPDDPAPTGARAIPRIEDAYLDRAIREVHLLEERMDACPGCAAAVLYGTLVMKCPHADPAGEPGEELEWLAEEIRVVRPRLIVVMGDNTRRAVDAMQMPMAEPLPAQPGVVAQWTPAIEALVTPDIDDSLDEQDAKRQFWAAFRALGEWWAAEPPY